MVRADAVRVHRDQAEEVRRRLAAAGLLRRDVEVGRTHEHVLFPVTSAPPDLPTEPVDLRAHPQRARAYVELLPPGLRHVAPRAFEQLGDIVVTKVPEEAYAHREVIGDALLDFTRARAVFHDAGVHDTLRTRRLERIAGAGTSETDIMENRVHLRIDPAAAYYSPRLATERARIAAMVRPKEHLIDLFGGVAPLGVQAALHGASVDSVDLNPAACALARVNVAQNGLQDHVTVHAGDARQVALRLRPADRLVMNLPHGAHAFLDLAPGLLRAEGVLHYHEIMDRTLIERRAQELAQCTPDAQVLGHRVVRTYSPQDDHVVFDVQV